MKWLESCYFFNLNLGKKIKIGVIFEIVCVLFVYLVKLIIFLCIEKESFYVVFM